jgi:hypothetical protein
MKRYMSALLVAFVTLGALLAAAPASAAPRTRCFSETNRCVSGAILDYWERNGGLAVFGYPINDLTTETNNDGWTGPTQWFERDRLEDHGAQGVMAGRLGAQVLEMQGRQWQQFPRVDKAGPGCRYFAETGHSLCGQFLTYWSKNGGLERFGYPISEQFVEDLPTYSGTVQYFERRRLEIHPENAGTPYEVLLGLLGRDVRTAMVGGCNEIVASLQKTAAAYPQPFSCGAPFPQVNVPIATQQFERGSMTWVKNTNGYGSIYVMFFDNNRNRMVYQYYHDSYVEGEAIGDGSTPPAGKVAPVRGFGKLWFTDKQVRETLGWAVAPEQGGRGHLQYFFTGASMLYRGVLDRVYLMYPDGTMDDIARIR